MEGMGTEAFAAVPFYWSGKAHGQQPKHPFAVLLHRIMAKPELTTLRQPRRFSLPA